jgi:uncharacterized protein YkuJ
MKKIILFTFLLILIIIGCSDKKHKSKFNQLSSSSFGLKGNIASFSEKRFPAILINDSIHELVKEPSGKIEIHKYFNKENVLLESENYDSDGNLFSVIKFLNDNSHKFYGTKTYDKNKRQISESQVINSTDSSVIIETLNLNQNSTSTSKMTYDKNGLIILNRTIINDTSSFEWQYLRNNEGRILLTRMINKFGSQIDTSVLYAKYLEFDSSGNWSKRIDYNSEKGDEIYVYERKIEYRNE